MTEDALLELAGRYRESLRHAVYLIRSLDAEGELSTAQVSTLNMVADGPARVTDIARNSGIRVPSATEQVIRLETAGLVTRGPDAHDARVVLVSLTPNGRNVLTEANRRRNSILAAQFAGLSAADREAITTAIPALDRLSSALSKPNQR